MDLNKIVSVRVWNYNLYQVEYVSVNLEEIVKNPQNGYNLVDVGFILLNIARQDLGLEPMPRSVVSE